jgi:tetrahydromethanopterin:alpha-L-glutamate ligase
MPRLPEQRPSNYDASGPLVVVIGDRMDWHARQLTGAVTSLGGRVMRCDLAQCAFNTTTPCGLTMPGLGAALPDAVLVRTISAGTFEAVTRRLGILHALRQLGVLVWNDARAIECCVDKSMTSFLMKRHGLPTPPSWAVESLQQARDLARQHAPLVLKPLFGSQGKGLRLIRSEIDLPDPITASGVYYLQRYQAVEANGFRDFRLLVLNGQVVASMIRHSTNWITNVKQGGRPVAAVADDKLKRLATGAAAAVGASFAGVDILIGADGNPTILEVNSMPAWSGLQRVTGTNIATAIATELLANIEGHHRRSLP